MESVSKTLVISRGTIEEGITALYSTCGRFGIKVKPGKRLRGYTLKKGKLHSRVDTKEKYSVNRLTRELTIITKSLPESPLKRSTVFKHKTQVETFNI